MNKKNKIINELVTKLRGTNDVLREYQMKISFAEREVDHCHNNAECTERVLAELRSKLREQDDELQTSKTVSQRLFTNLVGVLKLVMEDALELQNLEYIDALKLRFSECNRMIRYLGIDHGSELAETVDGFKCMYTNLEGIKEDLIDNLVNQKIDNFEHMNTFKSYTQYANVINEVLVLLGKPEEHLLSFVGYYNCEIAIQTVISEKTGKEF